MCLTCGCGDPENVRVTTLTADGRPLPDHPHPHPHDHEHEHEHDHHHPHDHDHSHETTHLHTPNAQPPDTNRSAAHPPAASTEELLIDGRILAKNDQLAEQNRRWLTERGIRAVNLMSSPGAGKTTLLERTIKESNQPISVIEGDQETVFDAERIQAAGARAVQVNTGTGCHLDATMVLQALQQLRPGDNGYVFIENVGNLVCPALFDLGEKRKVVVISVTEGDDKPLKYPHMFAGSFLVLNSTSITTPTTWMI
jgi:hydrogenase nickel incorporation protein HypB